jgi:4-hydroxy-tetrahydrodipicolinate synthase
VTLSGSICAIATPFRANGDLDLGAFRRLLVWHREAGTRGVVVGGSTGESVALEENELEHLVGTAADTLQGRCLLIAGCGAASTGKAVRLTQSALDMGAQAALVVTPFYVRPTQEGLYRHYTTLADEGGLPLVLYNVPSRTACDMLPETVARLSRHERIIGIKEARTEPERMDALIALRGEHFAVLSGDDPTALRALRAGADGVISVAANVCPKTFAALCEKARGNVQQAQDIDTRLASLYAFLGVEPNPIPVKWLLNRMGWIGSNLRLPLLELSERWHAQGAACLDVVRAIEGVGAFAAPSDDAGESKWRTA